MSVSHLFQIPVVGKKPCVIFKTDNRLPVMELVNDRFVICPSWRINRGIYAYAMVVNAIPKSLCIEASCFSMIIIYEQLCFREALS